MAVRLTDREFEPSTGETFFNIEVNGIPTAEITVIERGNVLNISDLFPLKGITDDMPLGVSGIMAIKSELKKYFPHATTVTGWRYGGARLTHSGEEEIEPVRIEYPL